MIKVPDKSSTIYSRSFVIFLIFFINFFCVNFIYASTHTAIIKVSNLNQRSTAAPVYNSDGDIWTQVYVEIPAKLYMDKGWLDDDLKNLRFIDLDSGNIELSYWVPPKADENLRVNNLGIWLLIKDLDPGETEKIKLEMVDGASFYANPRAGSDRQYDRTSYEAAATVMPFYAYNSWDWKWDKTNSDPFARNVKFLNNALYSEDDLWGDAKFGNNAVTSNEFTITIYNLKFYHINNDKLLFYFLSQAEDPNDLPRSKGYRLNFSNYVNKSDDFHYDRYQFTIKLQKYNSSSNRWITKAETIWQPYNNSRYIFDLKVSKDQIFILINGRQYNFIAKNGGSVTNGRYNRNDSFHKGRFGYDRGRWKLCCGTDINYFLLRRFMDKEPVYKVYGNADLIIIDSSSTPISNIGEDINEIVPDLQQLSTVINGNSLDDYIFATYSIARPEQIVDQYKIILKNRNTDSSETFLWHIQNSNPTDWIIYFCDVNGSNCSKQLPASSEIAPGHQLTYSIKIIPTPSALVNSSSTDIKIGVEAAGDASFDNTKIRIRTLSNLGCFWKYKAKQIISWNGGHGYLDLYDYQVRVIIENEPLLSFAKPNGSDIIITDHNNSVLDYWLKAFDPDEGYLEAWVKVPKIKHDSQTSIYVWWGNKNYGTSRSNKSKTFDLWEDWDNDYVVHNKVGCDDGTNDSNVHGINVNDSTLVGFSCSNQPLDAHGWENVPTPDDWYNWWEVESIDDNKFLQADISSSHKSGDKGPFLHHGGLGWDHYEVSYTIYTGTYHQYSGTTTWGNPQYNPVFFNDAGNMWGMEYFANKFIFRPYASGIDFVWQYQTNPKNLLGSSFPKRNRWYQAKVQIYRDKENGGSRLKLFMSQPETSFVDLPDPDSKSTEDFIKIADFDAPPAFTLKYGGIGFGGWDSGFGFDNIRVRKYVEDDNGREPSVVNSTISENILREELTLSNPQITAPIFSGRPVYIEAKAIPFAWRGDIVAYYADCFINGECKYSNCNVCGGNETCDGVSSDQCEYSDKLGTISVFGKIDDDTPKGVGFYLVKRNPGSRNSETNARRIFTSDGNGTFVNFDLSQCEYLKSFLGTNGLCSENDGLLDETEKLILFVRGYYINDEAFSRSSSRNFDSIDGYGDKDGIPEPDEQWKLADVLHSNPILIGIPNMVYGYEDYWDFVDENDKRPMVAYFMSNDGILHAVKLAHVDEEGTYRPDVNATELWAFIPHAILPKLKNSTDANHEYLADGLLRAIDVKFESSGWKTVLFGIGGRENIYAFAIDITNPNNPLLLWEKNSDSTGRIGTMISAPALGKIDTNGDGVLDKWVGIVGSGYDKDYLNNYENKNAWISIFDIETGNIIKQVRVSDKIGNVLTNIAVLRDPQTGEIKKIYFGDYFGALWRVGLDRLGRLDENAPLKDGDTLSETYDMLFWPSDYNSTTQATDPKYPITAQPRIAKGEGEEEFWVFFGTGDYDEYDSTYPNQYFLGLRDRAYSDGPYKINNLKNVTNSDNSTTQISSWYLQLGRNDNADFIINSSQLSNKTNNERVLRTPEIYGGIVFFTTFEPEDSPCGGGKSRFYAVNYRTGLLKSGLFIGYQTDRIRSVELPTSGVPSQPMIIEGENGKGTAVAAGLTSTSSNELEKVPLNPSAFSTALDILLWREKH